MSQARSVSRGFSTSVSSSKTLLKRPQPIAGFPLIKPLRKYFGEKDSIPLINHNPFQRKAHISSIFVFRPTEHCVHPQDTFIDSVRNREWCYNVKGTDGGQYIANYNAIDGLLYAFHQSICDGILIGSRNLIYAADFQFMPYFSSNFEHVGSLEPNLSELLFLQNELLRNEGFLNRPFPAVVITTESGKAVMNHKGQWIDFLDCQVLKHINPFTKRHNDVYIISSEKGAEEIRKRWREYSHLRERNIEDTLIVLSNDDEPSRIQTHLIPEVLWNEPLNIKYVTCEGGIALMLRLIDSGAMNQLQFNLMKRPITDICRDINKHQLECIQIPWQPVVSFDYDDCYECQFVLFDPLQGHGMEPSVAT